MHSSLKKRINKSSESLVCYTSVYLLWQYGLWSFQTGYVKLERFLRKNQHTQRKFLNFENWTNGEPQKLAKSEFFNLIILIFHVKKLKN